MNNPTHSGRNAFRRVSGRDLVKNLEAMDMDEIRRQQFAMRSFTDSVEVDDLPLPPATSHLERRMTSTSEEGSCWPDTAGPGDWPGELGSGQGMHSSSTNNTIDTIIEMKLAKDEESMDQQVGETQKYVMSVPGPGHVDQEMELHKSLLTETAETPGTTSSDEMESLAAVQALMDTAGQWDVDSPRQCKSPSNENDLSDQNAIRQEFNRVATQRPRPTTPSSWSALESYVIERDNKSRDVESAFVPISERMPPNCGAKIKVALPGQRDGSPNSGSFRGRQSSMPWSDFYETMAGQQQVQCAELNEQSEDQDLLETNPVYAHKAPPKPVVNRRSSVEWENFEEARQLHQEAGENNESCYEDTRTWDGNATFEAGDDQPDYQQQTASPPAEWASNSTDFGVVDALSENHLLEDQPCSSEMYSGDGTANDTPSASNPFAVSQPENPFADPSSIPAIAPTRVAPPPPLGQPAAYYPPPASDTYACGDISTTSTAADLSNPYYSNTQYSNIYYGYDQDAPPASTQDYPQPYDQNQLSQVVPTVDDYSYTSNPYSQPDACNQYGGEVAFDPYAQYGAQPASYEATETYSGQPEASQYNDANYTAAYDGYSDAYVGYEQDTQVDTTGYEQAPQVDITGTDAYGTSFEYNQEYRAGTEPSVAAVATTFLSQPILPPQRSRTPDPFSWEVQETAYEQHGSAVAPPPRPAPPMTPSRSPEPVFQDSSTSAAVALNPSGEDQMSGVTGSSKSPAPPRPGAPPPRPAAPSPSPVRPPPPSLSGSPFGERRAAEQAAAQKKQEEEEEDPWAKFRQMTEQVSSVVNKTTQQLSKLSENSAADDIVDESYVAQVGGNQGFQLNSAQKQILQMQEDQKKQKADKKKRGKRPPSPTYDPNREQDLEKAAAELVRKMQNTRADLADWKPPSGSQFAAQEQESSPEPTIEQKESFKQTTEKFADFSKEELKKEPPAPIPNNWAGFGDDSGPVLPSSDSDFFQKALAEKVKATANMDGFDGDETMAEDALVDPFAPISEPSLITESYDPFDTRPADEIIAQAKQRAELEQAKLETDQDLEFYAGSSNAKAALNVSRLSSPTPEGGSPAPATGDRPTGFEDDFKTEAGQYSHTPSPLYDEDDSAELREFPEKFTGDGWELMIRYPPKKKIMADRYWKPCYVRIQGNTLLLYADKKENKPFQEILLQASYSMSDVSLQAYDIYGKIHTVKLQHILYKERVGIRAGQISRLVEGHMTKYGMPLEHAAQSNILAKFACLNIDELTTFTNCVEDLLFHCTVKRESNPVHKQDEVQIHCYDEYSAHVDKDGIVSDQKARVRMFCLVFLTGSPFLEIGLNDRRRQGKEIVRRKDILPMYTERWIRFENLEFHNTVDEKLGRKTRWSKYNLRMDAF